MDIGKFQEFFFWCTVINIGIYLLVVVALLLLRDFYVKMLKTVFELDEETIRKGMYTYLANYKLLITVFSFTPWIALLVIR